MKFKVFRTKAFEKGFKKLPKKEQREVEKFEKEISNNPFVGRFLTYDFLREKKLNGRRVFYLIYQDLVIVLMVAISDKKAQQSTIDAIKEKLDDYYEIVKEALKNV